MFDLDDVDDDFFTPSKPSTLANIFSKKKRDESNDNPTLKYVAPKAEDVTSTTTQIQAQTVEAPNKTSECLLALAVFAYEWVNGAYVSRENLGFAIIKMFSLQQIRLVLYDSGKNKLSMAVASTKLDVIVHKNNCISYFDEAKRNWSLICTNSQDVETIIKELQNHGVQIKHKSDTLIDSPSTQENFDHSLKLADISNSECELPLKSKASIMNRMALMGHALLPFNQLNDLSDPNVKNDRIIKQRTVINTKRIGNEIDIIDSGSNLRELDSYCEDVSSMQVKLNDSTNMPSYNPLARQIIPLNVTSNNKHCENCQNFNSALSEQRISNSELRINISKLEYKMDQMAGNLNTKNNAMLEDSTFTADLTKKLLTEYENKIRNQNELIKQLETKLSLDNNDKKSGIQSCNVNQEILIQFKEYIKEIENYKVKQKDLEVLLSEKNTEIDNLKEQISDKVNVIQSDGDKVKEITNELSSLRNENKELKENTEKNVKSIMNNTYHTLAACFEGNEQYYGDNIKGIIGTTIKALTIKNLSK